MKRTAFLLTVGAGLLALGLCGTWAAVTMPERETVKLWNVKVGDRVQITQGEKRVGGEVIKIDTVRKTLIVKSPGGNQTVVVDANTIILRNVNVKTTVDSDIWTGVRGLKWGTNIADATGMVLIEENGNCKLYQRTGDKLTIGEAKLKKAVYGFYKGRFYSVNIDVEGSSNWTALKEATFAVYGEGEKPNEFSEGWYWGASIPPKPKPRETPHFQPLGQMARDVAIAGATGSTPTPGVKDVGMSLECDTISSTAGSRKEARLSMFYGPIKDEKKADEAKEAKKDF
ncbi:MAG: hypothetical protein IMZ44_17990 [Planctomycetes bacterium]|nr:hypothetical protein [Planctomycetota bacterium]